jgi:branched-chain amino acid transport system substrate-binding protein
MRMRTIAIAALLALTAALAVAAGAAARAQLASSPTSAGSADLAASKKSCLSSKLGFSGPLTGDAGFLGQEQLSWAQFAIKRFNAKYHSHISIVQGDTQLDPSLSKTVSQQFVANKTMMGVIGPSTSQGVISSKDAFFAAKMPMVSPSATRPSLTKGAREGGATFFRDVPNDDVQGPTDATFIIKKIKAKDVAIVTVRANPYSTALSDIMASRLQSAGVKVTRLTVEQDQKDYSTTVTRVPSSTTVVVLPWQQPPDAQTFANQLRLQGKRAVPFGTDGTYSPDQYKPTNGYSSSFANDLHFVKSKQSIVKAYNKFSHNKTFGTFGPPSYMATWILATAVKNSCADGKVSRAEVLKNVRKANVPSILGGRIKFTSIGDVAGAKFYVFHIVNGKYSPAG